VVFCPGHLVRTPWALGLALAPRAGDDQAGAAGNSWPASTLTDGRRRWSYEYERRAALAEDRIAKMKAEYDRRAFAVDSAPMICY
jgi:hypothetical protein